MKIRIKDDYVSRIINDELLLINKYENDEIFWFNEVSRLIIESIINSESKKNIVDKIVENYEVDCKLALSDFESFILDLIDSNIIEVQ